MNKKQLVSLVLSALGFMLVSFLFQCKKDSQSGLELVFSDEFTDTILNRKTWRTTFVPQQAGDNQQYFVDSAIVIKDGILHIMAKRDTVEGVVYDKQYHSSTKTFYYTSGLIQSGNGFAQQYGYFEIRCKVPYGKGFWPAFWMMPYWKWPPEIDVFEVSGAKPEGLHTTNHFLDKKNVHRQITSTVYGPDLSKNFHVYAIEWNPKQIIWYLDNKEVFHSEVGIPQEPMYLIASMGIGGAFCGYADSTVSFPASFDIDYIRVYKRTN